MVYIVCMYIYIFILGCKGCVFGILYSLRYIGMLSAIGCK